MTLWESLRRVSHFLIARSSLLWWEVNSLYLCRCVWEEMQCPCFNSFNLFMGDGISVAAVSGEMAPTGRSHGDYNYPPSIQHLTAFLPLPRTSHPQLLLPFLWLYSYFPLVTSSVFHLFVFDYMRIQRIFRNKHHGIFLFYSGRLEKQHLKWLVSQILTDFLLLIGPLLEVRKKFSFSSCSPSHLLLFLISPASPSPSPSSSLCPLGIELLIAFSMWKSLTSFCFVRALWSNGMCACCSGAIRIREHTRGRGV